VCFPGLTRQGNIHAPARRPPGFGTSEFCRAKAVTTRPVRNLFSGTSGRFFQRASAWNPCRRAFADGGRWPAGPDGEAAAVCCWTSPSPFGRSAARDRAGGCFCSAPSFRRNQAQTPNGLAGSEAKRATMGLSVGPINGPPTWLETGPLIVSGRDKPDELVWATNPICVASLSPAGPCQVKCLKRATPWSP